MTRRQEKREIEPDARDDESGKMEEGAAEVWDIVCTFYRKPEKSSCMGEACKKEALIRWASNLEPDEPWDCCVDCQEREFGGWPEGFDVNAAKGAEKEIVAKKKMAGGERDVEIVRQDAAGGEEEGVDEKRDAEGDGDASTETKENIDTSKDRDDPEPTTNDANEKDDELVSNDTDVKDEVSQEEAAPGKEESTKPEEKEELTKPEEKIKNHVEVKEVTEEEDGPEELWNLTKVLPLSELDSSSPITCSTPDCPLQACTAYNSNLEPNTWYSCLDCQEMDYGGWPDRAEMPEGYESMTVEHMTFIRDMCTRQHKPKMPPGCKLASEEDEDSDSVSSGPATPPSPPVNLITDKKNTLTPPPPSDKKKTFHSKSAKITPSPSSSQIKQKQPSAKALEMHRKWQEAAEKLGGKDARIVVSKPLAKELILKIFAESFCPMNIDTVYRNLKAVVPSGVLKGCLDDMTDGPEDIFFDSEDEDDEEDRRKKTSSKKKPKNSNDPFASTLCVKLGRNASSTLYFADQFKLTNNGDGLLPEDRNDLVAGLQVDQNTKMEYERELKRNDTGTAKLLKEPLNEDLVTMLASVEGSVEGLEEEVEKARELVVSEATVLKLNKRVDHMVTFWRKRKRTCMDFLMMIDESTDGAVSMKKCLKGDGQICIDSDEAVAKSAVEYGRNIREKKMKGGGRKMISPMMQAKRKKLKNNQSAGVGVPEVGDVGSASEDFVAVMLDSANKVSRIFIDCDEDDNMVF